jgi:hypothetical protein
MALPLAVSHGAATGANSGPWHRRMLGRPFSMPELARRRHVGFRLRNAGHAGAAHHVFQKATASLQHFLIRKLSCARAKVGSLDEQGRGKSLHNPAGTRPDAFALITLYIFPDNDPSQAT